MGRPKRLSVLLRPISVLSRLGTWRKLRSADEQEPACADWESKIKPAPHYCRRALARKSGVRLSRTALGFACGPVSGGNYTKSYGI